MILMPEDRVASWPHHAGDPLLEDYLAFVGARARVNTWQATADERAAAGASGGPAGERPAHRPSRPEVEE